MATDDDMFVPAAPMAPQSGHFAKCKTCDEAIGPNEATYRNCGNQRHRCGLAMKSVNQYFRRRPEVKSRFDAFTAEEQATCLKPVLSTQGHHVTGATRSQQLEQLVSLVNTTYRAKELRSREAMSLFDKGEFVAFMQYQKGKSRNTAKLAWKAAVRAGGPRVVTERGVTRLWTRLPRQMIVDDVVGARLDRAGEQVDVTRAAANQMMRIGVAPTAAASQALAVPEGLDIASDADAVAGTGDISDDAEAQSSDNGVDSEPDEPPHRPQQSHREPQQASQEQQPQPGSIPENRERGGATPSGVSGPDNAGMARNAPSGTGRADQPDGGSAPGHAESGPPPAPRSASPPSTGQKRPADTQTSELATLDELPSVASKPLQLSKVKMAFRAAVSDKTATYKDGDVEKPDAMLQALQKYSEHQDVKCLNVNEIAGEARKAFGALKTFSDVIDSWTVPLNVREKQAELLELFRDYAEKMDTLSDYKAVADDLDAKETREAQAARRQERHGVDSLAGQFNKAVAPRGVARAVALIFSKHMKMSDGQMMASSSQYPFELSWSDGLSHNEVFSLPRSLSAAVPEADRTHWHRELARVLSAEQKSLAAKTASYVEKLTTGQSLTGNGTHVLSSPFCWNPDGKSDPFQVTAELRPFFFVIKCMAYESPRLVLPCTGIGMFVSVVSGTVAAIIVRDVDVASFLNTVSNDTLKKEASCVTTAGESIWIPFGCQPVFIALPSTMLDPKSKPSRGRNRAADNRSDEWASLLCNLGCDAKDASRPKELCGMVVGELMKASAAIPDAIKKSDDFKAWRATVELAADPKAPATATPAA